MPEPELILLVDDDEELTELVSNFLQARGFAVHSENRGDLAYAAVEAHRPRLVILDITMPGATGLEVCRVLRARHPSLPIIMMTGHASEVDEVVGLELGADDYLAKPVRPRVLLARITALLRRSSAEARGEILAVGVLQISLADRRVCIDDEQLELSDAEFELLVFLARRAGTIVTRDDFFRELRGIDWDGMDRSMDVRVSRLRSSLGQAGRDLIRSVRGVGYQLVRGA